MTYFRTTIAVYTQIQPAINEVFRSDWIETGKCEQILPPVEEVSIRGDGLCYLAVPEWMLDQIGADTFRSWLGIEEITEEEFFEAIAEEANT